MLKPGKSQANQLVTLKYGLRTQYKILKFSVGLIETIVSEQSLDGGGEAGHEDIWGKSILDRGKSLGKVPTVGTCLVCMDIVKINITDRLRL